MLGDRMRVHAERMERLQDQRPGGYLVTRVDPRYEIECEKTNVVICGTSWKWVLEQVMKDFQRGME